MTEAWVRYLLMGVKKGEKKGEVNEIDPGDSALGWPHDVFKRQHRGLYPKPLSTTNLCQKQRLKQW